MNICIYEDSDHEKLYPLALTRPVFDLKFGFFTLLQRLLKSIKTTEKLRTSLLCRDYLKNRVKKENPSAAINKINKDLTIFLNGRMILRESLLRKLISLKKDAIFVDNQMIIAARLSDENLKQIDVKNPGESLKKIRAPRIKVKAQLIAHLWELITFNEKFLADDLKNTGLLGKIEGNVYPGVDYIEKKNIYIAKKSVIKSGTVLDAENGPIYIDESAIIEPNCTIVGPAYIGKSTKINAGAKILANTSIGDYCRIGGEVAESIFYGYSNKQHDGFIGHSYVGEWCNLGANTNNSDLKNNYSPIDIVENGKKVNTGLIHFGFVMGDHSKTGISTMINSGTVIGAGCNLYGAGYLPKYLPSFTWLDNGKTPVTYNFLKFSKTAHLVCQRRKSKFYKTDEAIFSNIFKLTKMERADYK
ncbi:MAG: putative sugar nucleotidyl transferase [Patescibacteria group bacterium]|jgi:UDP-N-acetylglucosamine diphosphorylase/glucosamine-1-phosphate N-acetyltransferase